MMIFKESKTSSKEKWGGPGESHVKKIKKKKEGNMVTYHFNMSFIERECMNNNVR